MSTQAKYIGSRLYKDLCYLPENLIGEILNGQIYTQPRPSGPHSLATTNLSIDIGNAFHKGRGGPGGWWILIEPEIHFVRDIQVIVPDLAGWKKEHMPQIPQSHHFEIIPDWVCEVISPSTASKDREIKMPLYAEYGVAYCWLVDPLEKTLEANQLQQNTWQSLGQWQNHDKVSITPFEAIEIALADLWVE